MSIDLKSLFNTDSLYYYRQFIKSFFIGGVKPEKIQNFKENKPRTSRKINSEDCPEECPVEAIVCIPSKELKSYNSTTMNMLYPDQVYNFDTPTFFMATLTAQGEYTFDIKEYIYCLKFSQIVNGKKLPVCFSIHSFKEDIDQFKAFLDILHSNFISLENIYSEKKIEDENELYHYISLELVNIFSFCFANFYKPSPHTVIRLKLPPISINSFNSPAQDERISWYFSSNTQIPCNKTDSCITQLFTFLDQSIIIKTVFKIITEYSVVFVSTDPSALFNILAGLRKIAFPLTWKYSYIPVMPINIRHYLDQPSQHLFGITRGNEKIDDIVKAANREFVVECDTNEIYSYQQYGRFCPLPSSELSTRTIDIRYHKGCLVKYNNKEQKYEKVVFLKEGKVIIDCDDNNKLLVENSDNLMSDNESSTFRKNLQEIKMKNYLRNQMDEDYDNKKKKRKKYKDTNEYEINKAFAKLISKKIENPKDPLAIDVKRLNNFVCYKTAGKYQNDSEKRIIENLEKVEKNEISERNYGNAVFFSYTIPHLDISSIKTILEDIDEDKTKDEFEKILKDYEKILAITSPGEECRRSDFSMTGERLVPFYGEKGLFSNIKIIVDTIEKRDKFYENLFQIPLYEDLKSMLEGKGQEGNKILEVFSMDGKKMIKDLESMPESLSTAAIILNVFYGSLKPIFDNDDEKYLNKNEIFELFRKSCSKDKIEFPYYDFYQFLKKMLEKDLIALEKKTEEEDMKEIIKAIINK